LIQVVTLESDPLMIAIANDAIMKAEQSSHIRILEGDALETLPTLHGPFDIIFIDADKKDYIEFYDMIMERRLLAQDGIILADNVLALGCTVDSTVGKPNDSAQKNGAELRKFNDHIAEDDRVDVCVLPMFDGLALIKWRPNMYPLTRVQSHLSIHNGFATNGGGRPRSIHRGSFDLHNQRSPSRNSHDLSRTGTPSFHARRLSDEVEEKDEFSYGFSNRRNSHEEQDDESGPARRVDEFPRRTGNQFVHPVGGYEARNKYYD
jgi:hypothetical protein